MSTIDGLSVRVSAAVSQFTTGMSRAEDAAQDVSLSLRRLGASSSSAERELDSAGRSATTTAAQMGVLTSATNSTNASFMGLSATTIASLVPAMGTLLAALAPVIAALGGFVAIAGSIGAVGIVGVLAGIAEGGDRLKNRFNEVVGTLQEAFAPAMELAASVLMQLLNAFDRIIWELVPSRQALETLAAQFLNLGEAVINALPALVDLAVSLATEFLPVLVRFAQDVLPEIPRIIGGLVQRFRDLAPMFMNMAETVGNLIPPLMEFGMTALPVVADAMGRISGITIDVLDAINSLGDGAGGLIAQLSLIAPVVTTLVSFLGGPATAAIAGLAAAWITNFADIRGVFNETVAQVTDVLENRLPPLITAVTAAWEEWGPVITRIANTAFDFFSTYIVGSLDAIISILTAVSQVLTGNFAGAWDTVTGLIRRNLSRIATLVMPIIRGALDSVTTYLATQGPGLIQSAFRTLGSATRTALVGAFNFLFRGGFERMVLTAFGKIVSYIIEDFPGDLKAGITTAWNLAKDALAGGVDIMQTVFDTVLIPAVRGFVNGLFGDDSAFGNIVTRASVLFGKLATTFMLGVNRLRNIFADVFNWLITRFGDTFNTILSTVTDGLNGIISIINQAIGAIPWDQVPGSDRPEEIGQVTAPQIDTSMRMQDATTDREVIRERVTDRIARITVEDGEIVAKMEDEARTVVNEQQRSTRRRQGRAGYDV